MSDAVSTPATAQSANKAARTLKTSGTLRMLNSLGVYVVVLLLVLVGAAAFRGRFLSADNALVILRSVTTIGIIATGVSFITYGGRYVDMSIPNLIALVGFVTLSAQPLGIVGAIACGLAAGAAVGAINGYIIGYLRLNPIIWTLAMNFLLGGFAKWMFSGKQAYPDAAPGSTGSHFLMLAEYELPLRIPLATGLLLAIVPVAWWLMKRTRFGTQVQQTGAAYEAARLSGIPVQSVILRTFVLSGLLSAIAAIFLASGSKAATFELGQGLDFSAVTAVVLGGVLLSGGSGSVLGVIGGVLVIGLLDQLVTLCGGGLYDQMIVKGLVFILVVGLTSWSARKGGRGNV